MNQASAPGLNCQCSTISVQRGKHKSEGGLVFIVCVCEVEVGFVCVCVCELEVEVGFMCVCVYVCVRWWDLCVCVCVCERWPGVGIHLCV